MSEYDRPGGRRIGSQALQASEPAHSVRRKTADLLGDFRSRGDDRVVVPRPDAHDPRRFGGTEADREERAERDRNLAEQLPRPALADHALDAVDGFHRLDPTLEHGEERTFVALVDDVLARSKGDVRGRTREPEAIIDVQICEDGHPTDLVHRHHRDERYPAAREPG